MIIILYLILLVILSILLILNFLKVNVYIYAEISNIDVIKLRIIFSIKSIKLYTYTLYIRSGIVKLIKKDKIKDKKSLDIFKIIKQISKEEIDIKISLGVNNIILTNYLIVLFTTILSIVCSKYIKLENREKVKYNVVPNYNSSCIIFESMLKIRLVTFILFFIKIKAGGKKYGRTSN